MAKILFKFPIVVNNENQFHPGALKNLNNFNRVQQHDQRKLFISINEIDGRTPTCQQHEREANEWMKNREIHTRTDEK